MDAVAQVELGEDVAAVRLHGGVADDELARVAPREIAADVQTLFAGMRQRAGLKPAKQVSEAQASAAESRIRAFERRSCPT